MMSGWWDEFRSYMAKPFSADMPASHWFLFLGMLIIIIMLWGMILNHLVNALKGT